MKVFKNGTSRQARKFRRKAKVFAAKERERVKKKEEVKKGRRREEGNGFEGVYGGDTGRERFDGRASKGISKEVRRIVWSRIRGKGFRGSGAFTDARWV